MNQEPATARDAALTRLGELVMRLSFKDRRHLLATLIEEFPHSDFMQIMEPSIEAMLTNRFGIPRESYNGTAFDKVVSIALTVQPVVAEVK